MTLFKYEVLNTVIKLGSITKAAEALNLTQSGISHAISSLEAEMGFVLLAKSRLGIRLTGDGERIMASIRQVLAQNEIVKQQVALIKGFELGTVSIGTFSSVSMQWLPEIIKDFKNSHPTIEIQLLEGTYETIQKLIDDCQVDFGFMSARTAKAFDFIPLMKDPIVCVMPHGHKLQDRKRVSFEQLQDEIWIMPKWGPADDLRQCLKENVSNAKIEYEAAEPATVVSMVGHGLGISLLPKMVLAWQQENHNIHIINLDKSYYRLIGLAAPSFKKLSPAAIAFIDCVKKYLVS